jgi:hypothetical protein
MLVSQECNAEEKIGRKKQKFERRSKPMQQKYVRRSKQSKQEPFGALQLHSKLNLSNIPQQFCQEDHPG